MYPVSEDFLDALTKPHKICTLAQVTDDTGAVLATLNVLTGRVTVDEDAGIRRTATVQLDAGDLVPETAADILGPASGNELRLWRGITLDSGDELVPLGVFRLGRVRIYDNDTSLTIDITGYDRAKRIQRNRWTDPYRIAAGTNVATAVSDILTDRWPSAPQNLMVTTRTTPETVFGLERDNNPWADAQSLAKAIGAELFFNQAGVATMRPIPDAATDPISFTYAEGETATILDLDRDLDDEQTYNGVIATGEGAGVTTPVRAESWDTDPDSPTYYLGDYGKVPYFFHSPLITSAPQAQDAADSILRRVLHAGEQLRFNAVVNPAHEAGDVVQVTRSRSKVDSAYVLASVPIPLAAEEPMTCTTRQRRVLP